MRIYNEIINIGFIVFTWADVKSFRLKFFKKQNYFWYTYKLNPLHYKHLVFLINTQLSSNPVLNLTLYTAVETVGRLQFELSQGTGSFIDHLAWYLKRFL